MWARLGISVLILAAGLWGATSLKSVDQELRVIYAEYTLAATDLGHMNADLIRYRTSMLRAIAADTEQDFRRIVEPLPEKRIQIERPLEQFIKTIRAASVHSQGSSEELAELQAVKSRVAEYMATAEETIGMLEQRWKTADPIEAKRLHDLAEENAAERAGAKFIAITLELDRLLEVVAGIAGDARDDADRQLRLMSTIVIVVSTALVLLVLFARRD
ncbi:MAG: MCP four helix bundle domain-containing protein [Nitrospira sp.]